MFTINSIYIPLYIRMVPNNMFKLETNHLFSIALIVSHIIQIVIFHIQGLYGGGLHYFKKFIYKANVTDVVKTNRDFNTITCLICSKHL